MAKPISSDSLFHFTNSLDSVIGILENGFYLNFCEEANPLLIPKFSKIFICMVSFCDIPIEHSYIHSNKYGKFAIGLKKSWGGQNMINPVFYVTDDFMDILENIVYHDNNFMSEFLTAIHPSDNTEDKYLKEIRNAEPHYITQRLLSIYIKLYMKRLNDNENYYYDEREWRYTPLQLVLNQEYSGLLYTHDKDAPFMKSFYNNEGPKFPLKFTPKDINYIIVDSPESEVRLRKHIATNQKYSYDDIMLLQNVIIIYKDIEMP